MTILTQVRSSEYHDSVSLMQAAAQVSRLSGIEDAAVVMGTPANREFLAAAGLLTAEAAAAHPEDLVIVVRAGGQEAAEAALRRVTELLAARPASPSDGAAFRPRSLATALAATPGANLVIISVSGRYAAAEARTALEHGLHLLLFSDNVALEDEIALKQLAGERGLLCMGPDAGTAIINGVALGFANVVPRGPVGLVGASGTGLQAVTCGLARAGAGVSQVIGVGGRDLSEPVGGAMMLAGMAALRADPDTRVLALVAKHPSASAERRILDEVRRIGKPCVICFLGCDRESIEHAGAFAAPDLAMAGVMAAALAHDEDPHRAAGRLAERRRDLRSLVEEQRSGLAPGQHVLRGLFAGGTFCAEAQWLLRSLPDPVWSNAPLVEGRRMANPLVSSGHACVDLGDDIFTQGRPHPMIDPELRNRRILQEARDPAVAVILLDIVLGFGAHEDPAGATAVAIRDAQDLARLAGRRLCFVTSVCGTEADPQVLSRQEQTLRDCGALVLTDSASASLLAGLLVQASPADGAGVSGAPEGRPGGAA